MTDREKLLDAAARAVIAHIENFYQDHLPGCATAAGDGKVCDCGLDALRAALRGGHAINAEKDPYLDSRTAPFRGRVGDEMLDEIRVAVNGAYADGFADGQEERE